MPPLSRRLLALTAAAMVATAAAVPCSHSDSRFARTIAELSEPGGYFDSNNLVSNEKSYLQVIPALHDAGLSGGMYIGVGPDQNFSYIAQIRPSIAFLLDIRRDNLLLHLIFKALFHLAKTRAEYLSLLFGRPAPTPPGEWTEEDIERIAAYIDATGAQPESVNALRARVDAVIRASGVPLSVEDFATIDRFHRTFIERGLELKFESAGRSPRSYYPTYRELLLETDTSGHRWNYLTSEADFQRVRALQERDLVIPVVGNLAGPTAMRAIGRLSKDRGERLSAIYTSNAEYYLSDGAFQQFVANLSQLPHDGRSLVIRAVFTNRFAWVQAAPGYHSVSLVQRLDDLLEGASTGRIREYRDLLVSR
jgi:hypothetical protein